METERIALNQRERDRLRVLHEIRRKHITQCEAAKRLKISDRHIRRLLVELRKRRDWQFAGRFYFSHRGACFPARIAVAARCTASMIAV